MLFIEKFIRFWSFEVASEDVYLTELINYAELPTDLNMSEPNICKIFNL
jgi:hypothetical protein